MRALPAMNEKTDTNHTMHCQWCTNNGRSGNLERHTTNQFTFGSLTDDAGLVLFHYLTTSGCPRLAKSQFVPLTDG